MLLLIDAGNTRIKWAVAEAGAALGQWRASGAAAHVDPHVDPHAELDTLAADWRAHRVTQVIIANVAGAALRARLLPLLPPVPVSWFASQAQLGGLRNGYRDPGQLGCDRFAAAIGARALAPGKALVVATCGTATTIDALSADGVFIGGMIAPGLALMAASLAHNTAQLPQVAPQDGQLARFADNTADAIVAGCLSAQAGAIERACALHGADECIISGGAARFIAPVLALPHRQVDNIVLVGLHASATPP
ncbi:MAG: type III pantothenate kinase [Pseudomonadota bacterium]